MKKKVFEILKKELLYIGLIFILFIIIFKVAFYKESFIVVLKVVFTLIWAFALPGYFIMFYWREKLDFVERFIIGIALSLAVIGILSYYLGIFGLNIKYHIILLPPLFIVLGLIFIFYKKD